MARTKATLSALCRDPASAGTETFGGIHFRFVQLAFGSWRCESLRQIAAQKAIGRRGWADVRWPPLPTCARTVLSRAARRGACWPRLQARCSPRAWEFLSSRLLGRGRTRGIRVWLPRRRSAPAEPGPGYLTSAHLSHSRATYGRPGPETRPGPHLSPTASGTA